MRTALFVLALVALLCLSAVAQQNTAPGGVAAFYSESLLPRAGSGGPGIPRSGTAARTPSRNAGSGRLQAKSSAGEEKQALLMRQAAERSNAVADGLDGVVGIGVKDLTSGQTWYRNGNEIFPTASTIKTAILYELLHQRDQGRVDLNERVTIRHAMTANDGGMFNQFGDATTTMSLHDIAVAMIIDSENTATNIVIDRVGMENVNRDLRALGLEHTLLRRRMIDLPAARAGRENVATAEDMLRLLEVIYTGKALSAQSRSDYMTLLGAADKSGTMLSLGVPAEIKVMNKPGWLEGVRCDCGLVEEPHRPYELCVFTTFDKDVVEAMHAISVISRIWYEYFHRLAISSEYGRAIPP